MLLAIMDTVNKGMTLLDTERYLGEQLLHYNNVLVELDSSSIYREDVEETVSVLSSFLKQLKAYDAPVYHHWLCRISGDFYTLELSVYEPEDEVYSACEELGML